MTTLTFQVTPDEIKDIQATVDRIIKEKQPYERAVLPKEVALEMFKENPYKVPKRNPRFKSSKVRFPMALHAQHIDVVL